MRNLLLSLLVVLGVIGMQAEEVHVQTPGTLQDVLMDMDFSASQLTITGTLNAADLSYIHKGTGRLANVTAIDISGITVIPSDESYVSECLGVEQGSTNSLSMGSFYYSNENRCDTIESTNMMGISSVHYKVYGNRLAGLFRASHYKKVVLPNGLDRIGRYMFECSAVEEAPIPEACTKVEARAFSQSKVTSVKLPPTCTSVGVGAFSSCSLKSINLENVCNLGRSAFNNSALEGAVQLGKVEEIPDWCFNGTGITSVKLQKGLVSIGDYAFMETKIPSIVLPDGLKTLGKGAFSNCEELKTISVPQSLTFIGSSAFPKDWVLTQKSEDGVYYIGKVAYGFAETAKGMTELKFKDGTISLSSNLCNTISSFSYDGAAEVYFKESLVSVDIPASVESIGDSDYGDYGIFSGCEKLTTVTLHEGLKSIGRGAFYNCSSLKNITLPRSLEYIGHSAFANTGITSMTWGENMKIVAYDAFVGCNSLVSLRIETPRLYDEREYAHLSDCSLEKVVFSPKVEYIPQYLFSKNTSLARIVFEEDDSNAVPLEIGRDAFNGCTALKIGKLPKRLVKIGSFAFEKCNFSEGKFSSQNIEFMDYHAFAYCKGLNYLELSPALKYCDMAFDKIKDLKEVRYDAVELECGKIFRGCSLEKVTIGSHVRKMQTGLFSGYELTLEFEDRTANGEDDSLEIPEKCFYRTTVTNLVLPDVPTKIGKEAFRGCDIKTLRLGLGTDSIADYAFYDNRFEVFDVPPTVNYMCSNFAPFANVIMHTMTSPKVWGKTNKGIALYYPKGCVYTGNQEFGAYKEYEIRMSESSVKLGLGETAQINGKVIVEDADPDVYERLSHIVWESSDPSVATVDESGKITAVGNGTAIITAYSSYKGGYGAKCLVTAGDISGIAETGTSDDVKVSVNNGIVTVSGVNADSVVTVLSVDGKKVLRTKEKTITGLASDLYIISVGNKNFKVKL